MNSVREGEIPDDIAYMQNVMLMLVSNRITFLADQNKSRQPRTLVSAKVHPSVMSSYANVLPRRYLLERREKYTVVVNSLTRSMHLLLLFRH